MSVLKVELNETNSKKLAALAKQTGRSPDALANEAVEKFTPAASGSEDPEEARKFQLWREAMLRVEGIWADRDDLPDFEEIRRSMDRDLWSR